MKAKQQELADSDQAKGATQDDAVYEAIASDYEANKDAVIEMLIANVMNVNIEIPKVVRGDFEETEDK